MLFFLLPVVGFSPATPPPFTIFAIKKSGLQHEKLLALLTFKRIKCCRSRLNEGPLSASSTRVSCQLSVVLVDAAFADVAAVACRMWSRLMPESVKQKLSTASSTHPFFRPGSFPNSTNLPAHKQQQTPAAGVQNRRKKNKKTKKQQK